ncbi:MAG: CRISPR system precrRNA processing endoribonuclease RAMP protein Cas6 [bacterium]|nr:CRISPR system precrRNA processing endoribonuclease RAMP protein Cas6 [bacterium]
MLSRLKIRLEKEANLSYQMGSLFQGALMELLSEELGELLHRPERHAYAQHLEYSDGRWYWVITTMAEELRRGIILEGLMLRSSISIKKNEMEIKFEEKQLMELPLEQLSRRMYEGDASRYLQLSFLTPTAFKINGSYVFHPDVRAMYISLMNRYAAMDPTQDMRDEDALEELVKATQIVRYNLKSTRFFLESTSVPSFVGSLTLRFGGTQTMCRFADFLFHVGEYSGIGIKTSMGMGAIRLIENGADRNDRHTN